jgi:hypothetical protein
VSVWKRVGLFAHPREELLVDIATGHDQDQGVADVIQVRNGGERGPRSTFRKRSGSLSYR